MSECCAEGNNVILYACSRAADVGQIADKVTRQLARESFGSMSCIAAIGAGLSGYAESAKGATQNIAVDGCDNRCAKLSLEKVGVVPKSFVLTEMGLKKGATAITDSLIRSVRQKIEAG